MAKGDSYDRWYRENREKVLAKRRRAYREDPVLRKRTKARVARYKREQRRRVSGGRTYGTGDVREKLGVSRTTLRQWEDHGYIPCVAEPGSHRRYTRNQVRQIRRIMQFMDQHWWRVREPKVRAKRDALVERVHAEWEG